MIKTLNYGKHENVLIAGFGKGDIGFIGGSKEEGGIGNQLVFYNQKEAGFENWDVAKQGQFKNTDELPVKFVMVFDNSKSITFLIHSLIEIQEQIQDEESLVPTDI